MISFTADFRLSIVDRACVHVVVGNPSLAYHHGRNGEVEEAPIWRSRQEETGLANT